MSASDWVTLAGDALGDAARIIAINGLIAEGAARRGDEEAMVEALRAVATALEAARDAYAISTGRAARDAYAISTGRAARDAYAISTGSAA